MLEEERMATLYIATSTEYWKAPDPVGYIVIAEGYTVEVYKRPNVFHMLMMHLFFGWEYQPVQE